VVHGGVMPYTEAHDLQRTFVADVLESRRAGRTPINRLLLLQHSPVFTVGIRGALYSAGDERRLLELGADFVRLAIARRPFA